MKHFFPLVACSTFLVACAASSSLSPPHPELGQQLANASGLVLRGEALASSGDSAQASECLTQAREIATSVLSSDPGSAQAHRIVGRTMLRQWSQFAPADIEREFELAETCATTDLDGQRARDYRAVVRGLVAYQDGRLADAWKAWSAIANDEIQQGLTASVRDVQADATFAGLDLQ